MVLFVGRLAALKRETSSSLGLSFGLRRASDAGEVCLGLGEEKRPPEREKRV